MPITSSRLQSPLAAISLDASEESLDTPANEETEGGEEDKDERVKPESDETAEEILDRLRAWVDDKNIARHCTDEQLAELGMLCVREYNIDEQSRAEWKAEAEKALDFSTQKAEPKQYPWPDASNVIFPLITSAALRFGAIAYPAIVPGRMVCKGAVWGDDKGTPVTETGKVGDAPKVHPDGTPVWLIPPGAKAIRAQRIGEHISYQLIVEMQYWEEQTDTMLHQIPIIGGAVRKTYRNMTDNCNESELVSIMDLSWNMGAKSFEKAPRHTEIQRFYPFEIEELERDEDTFLPKLYGPGEQSPVANDGIDAPPVSSDDTSAPHTYIHQVRRYDLDGDGYPEPLCVTVHLRSSEVVRITAAYEEDGIKFDEKTSEIKRIEKLDIYTLYRFLPNPRGGSYPCGFGHYLKPLNEAINTSLNQMFDAGHLQIAGGGFFGTGISLSSGKMNFELGEYKPVNNKGQSIRDSVYTIPWPGPNAVLFELLGLLIGAGKEIASIQDILTGDAAMANAPPTTALALIEQGMKVYTAIYKRIYRSLSAELAKLHRLNRLYLEQEESYQHGDSWKTITPEDYRASGGVEPQADATMVTDGQRLGRAALIVDRASKSPLVNQLAAERYLFEAANIARIDDFLPDKMPPPQPSPEQMDAQTRQQAAQARAKTDADKTGIEGARLKLEFAEQQSKLGLIRAQEMAAMGAAMASFAKARATLDDKQIAWMEANLNNMRLNIEAMNTSVRAAQVDAKMHGDRLSHHATMTGHAVTHHGNLEDIKHRAKELAHERQAADGPPDDGGGGGNPAPIPQPGNPGDDGTGVSAMAPSPGDSGLPPFSGTPPGQPLPGGD